MRILILVFILPVIHCRDLGIRDRSDMLVCGAKKTRKTVMLGENGSIAFSTQNGDSYGGKVNCNIKFKRKKNADCKLSFSCSSFDISNQKSTCKGGDFFMIQKQKYCQTTGPEVIETGASLNVLFKSSKKSRGGPGAQCVAKCQSNSPATTTASPTTTSVPDSCASVVIQTNDWGDVYQGKLRIPVTSYTSQYGISITADKPVDGLQFYEGSLSGSGTSFSLNNPSYFGGKHAGEFIEVGFQFNYDGSKPSFSSIMLNGESVCGGGGGGGGGGASTAPTTAPPATGAPATGAPTTAAPTTPPQGSGQCSNEAHDYGEVLRLSLLFYEAQRSGKLPTDNRVPWRGDSSLGDSGNGGEDLTGGYHDAGDYVKFGLPMASAMTILAYGGISYGEAYEAAGQMGYLKDAIKWGTDYFIKAHVSNNEFYCQVGNGVEDHAYPGRPETMTIPRPAYSLTPSKPGSDCAGETVASLASAAILFEGSDAAYSAKLLKHAKQLFTFADTYRGIYSNSIGDADIFYHSGGYEDELIWAAAWLYKATGDEVYLSKAESMYASRKQTWTSWSFDWADKLPGVQLLLFQLTGKSGYKSDVQQFCDAAMAVEKSPGGQTFRAEWGSNRYAANFAFICLGAADAGIKTEDYTAYAASQIGYMLGENPSKFSYVVGYGDKFPKQPHHKAAACESVPAQCTWGTFGDTSKPNPHQLNGALVGGPSAANDYYKDDRTDYIMAEITLDYNAGFQSTVAGLKAQACAE